MAAPAPRVRSAGMLGTVAGLQLRDRAPPTPFRDDGTHAHGDDVEAVAMVPWLPQATDEDIDTDASREAVDMLAHLTGHGLNHSPEQLQKVMQLYIDATTLSARALLARLSTGRLDLGHRPEMMPTAAPPGHVRDGDGIARRPFMRTEALNAVMDADDSGATDMLCRLLAYVEETGQSAKTLMDMPPDAPEGASPAAAEGAASAAVDDALYGPPSGRWNAHVNDIVDGAQLTLEQEKECLRQAIRRRREYIQHVTYTLSDDQRQARTCARFCPTEKPNLHVNTPPCVRGRSCILARADKRYGIRGMTEPAVGMAAMTPAQWETFRRTGQPPENTGMCLFCLWDSTIRLATCSTWGEMHRKARDWVGASAAGASSTPAPDAGDHAGDHAGDDAGSGGTDGADGDTYVPRTRAEALRRHFSPFSQVLCGAKRLVEVDKPGGYNSDVCFRMNTHAFNGLTGYVPRFSLSMLSASRQEEPRTGDAFWLISLSAMAWEPGSMAEEARAAQGSVLAHMHTSATTATATPPGRVVPPSTSTSTSTSSSAGLPASSHTTRMSVIQDAVRESATEQALRAYAVRSAFDAETVLNKVHREPVVMSEQRKAKLAAEKREAERRRKAAAAAKAAGLPEPTHTRRRKRRKGADKHSRMQFATELKRPDGTPIPTADVIHAAMGKLEDPVFPRTQERVTAMFKTNMMQQGRKTPLALGVLPSDVSAVSSRAARGAVDTSTALLRQFQRERRPPKGRTREKRKRQNTDGTKDTKANTDTITLTEADTKAVHARRKRARAGSVVAPPPAAHPSRAADADPLAMRPPTRQELARAQHEDQALRQSMLWRDDDALDGRPASSHAAADASASDAPTRGRISAASRHRKRRGPPSQNGTGKRASMVVYDRVVAANSRMDDTQKGEAVAALPPECVDSSRMGTETPRFDHPHF